MTNLWARQGGLYLGYPARAKRPLQITTDRHLICVGPNGSGKSRRVLMANLLNLTRWSMVVLDIKGELYEQTAGWRAANGSKIIRLNPGNIGGFGSDGFNPICRLKPERMDFVDNVGAMAETISPVSRHENPHWPSTAQDLDSSCIMYSRLVQPQGGSFGHVRAILGQPIAGFVKDVRAMMQVAIKTGCEELFVKASRYRDLSGSKENKELESVISHLLTNTRFIDSRGNREDLSSQEERDFDSLKHMPTTVYVMVDPSRMATAGPWARLVLTCILQDLMRDPRPGDVPVMLMMDEASQLDFPLLERSMSILRGMGLKLLSVYQDAPQAELALGRERFLSYVANQGSLIAFAPQDYHTAEMLSRMAGYRTAMSYGYQEGRVSISPVKVPLILPQDLMGMPDGIALVMTHQHRGPMLNYFPDPSAIPEIAPLMAREVFQQTSGISGSGRAA